jgi:hypothetical protein
MCFHLLHQLLHLLHLLFLLDHHNFLLNFLVVDLLEEYFLLHPYYQYKLLLLHLNLLLFH